MTCPKTPTNTNMIPSIKEFLAFRRSFDKKNGERFGQAFCNKFAFHNQTLFYTEDRSVAEQIIAELLVDDNGDDLDRDENLYKFDGENYVKIA